MEVQTQPQTQIQDTTIDIATASIKRNSPQPDQDSGLDMEMDSPTPPMVVSPPSASAPASAEPDQLNSDSLHVIDLSSSSSSESKTSGGEGAIVSTKDRRPGTSDAIQELDPYADEPDETLAERLWGLTEMVPEPIRNFVDAAVSSAWSGVKLSYSLGRSVSWIIASSSVILLAPVLFEVERVKVQEMQKNQQKQFLLGPSAAVSGGGVPAPPLPR